MKDPQTQKNLGDLVAELPVDTKVYEELSPGKDSYLPCSSSSPLVVPHGVGWSCFGMTCYLQCAAGYVPVYPVARCDPQRQGGSYWMHAAMCAKDDGACKWLEEFDMLPQPSITYASGSWNAMEALTGVMGALPVTLAQDYSISLTIRPASSLSSSGSSGFSEILSLSYNVNINGSSNSSTTPSSNSTNATGWRQIVGLYTENRILYAVFFLPDVYTVPLDTKDEYYSSRFASRTNITTQSSFAGKLYANRITGPVIEFNRKYDVTVGVSGGIGTFSVQSVMANFSTRVAVSVPTDLPLKGAILTPSPWNPSAQVFAKNLQYKPCAVCDAWQLAPTTKKLNCLIIDKFVQSGACRVTDCGYDCDVAKQAEILAQCPEIV